MRRLEAWSRQILPVLLLVGCHGNLANAPDGERRSSPAADPAIGYVIGELPGQELLGTCGMFLFTPLPRARFVFFANWTRNTALIKLDDEEIKLVTDPDFVSIVDQYPIQRGFISAEARIRVEIAVTPEDAGMPDGSRISSGLIRIKNKHGWVQIVPVAGAFACT